MSIVEANRQMEYCRPFIGNKRRTDEPGGSEHLLEGENDDNKFICFKCERSKPNCHGTRHCAFDKKVDGTTANSQEAIATKMQEYQANKSRRKLGGVAGGTSHVIQGQAVPA